MPGLTDAANDAIDPGVKRKRRKRSKRKPGRPAKLTSAKELARQQRVADFVSLRLQGWSLRAIGEAQEPPISAQRVEQIISENFEDSVTVPVAQLKKLEGERLDELQVKPYEDAVKGNRLALDRVLAIMDRRHRLFGLYAPEKLTVEEVGEAADPKATLLAKLKVIAGRIKPAIAATPLLEHDADDSLASELR